MLIFFFKFKFSLIFRAAFFWCFFFSLYVYVHFKMFLFYFVYKFTHVTTKQQNFPQFFFILQVLRVQYVHSMCGYILTHRNIKKSRIEWLCVCISLTHKKKYIQLKCFLFFPIKKFFWILCLFFFKRHIHMYTHTATFFLLVRCVARATTLSHRARVRTHTHAQTYIYFLNN